MTGRGIDSYVAWNLDHPQGMNPAMVALFAKARDERLARIQHLRNEHDLAAEAFMAHHRAGNHERATDWRLTVEEIEAELVELLDAREVVRL